MFQDLEDGSPIQQKDDCVKIIFGNFGEDSNLDAIPTVPFIPIVLDFDESTIKIGEIDCLLAAVKRRNDGGFFEKVAATRSLDIESNTVGLQSNTTEEIKTDCNICTKDEEKEIAKEEIEQKNSSVPMANSNFIAAGKQTYPDLEHILFSEIAPLISTSINKSASRFTTPPKPPDWTLAAVAHSPSLSAPPDFRCCVVSTMRFIPTPLCSFSHIHSYQGIVLLVFDEMPDWTVDAEHVIISWPRISLLFVVPYDCWVSQYVKIQINVRTAHQVTDDMPKMIVGLSTSLIIRFIRTGFSGSGTLNFVEYAKANSLLLLDHHMFVEMPLSNCFYTVINKL